MLLRRERIIAFGSKFMTLDIGVLVGAFGHSIERQIRNFGERFLELLGDRLLRWGLPRSLIHAHDPTLC